MGGLRCKREGDDPQHLRIFPKQKLILTHYILSTLCLKLLNGLWHYVIRQGAIEQVLVMANNLITLG